MKELIWHRQLLPAVERYADQPTITDGERSSTYAEHLDRVLRLTNAMRVQLGLRQEDRFAVLALNSARFQELYHAGLMGAGIVNPLNLRFAPPELVHVLNDSGTKVCFVDAIFAGVIAGIRDSTLLEKVVLMGAGDVPHDVKYEDLIAAGEAVVPLEPEEDTAALLMYTGGTTGLPKGVLLDQRAMTLTMYHIALTFDFTEGDVYLLQTPMFHAASLGGITAVPVGGGHVVTIPVFDPGAVLAAVDEHRCTNTLMVPTMIAMTFAHPEYRPERMHSLTTLTYGASPMPAPILERLMTEQPQLELYQGYGMTESAALVSALKPEDHQRGGAILRSAGRPVIGVSVSIQDADGNLLPQGEAGEVCIRGGNFMREYWRRTEETEAAFRGDWYHTGDMGYLDAEGYLYLVDRVKDMIVTGGENVYSTEVEQALASHPAVAQVAVVGIPDDTWVKPCTPSSS